MTDSEAVRRVALALPRAYEVQVRGQWKFRVGQIVFVAFSADEQEMGFGFPTRDARRAGRVGAGRSSSCRPRATCASSGCAPGCPRWADDEMRELVVDAWRMCVPKMLHELPELPAPAARVWDLIDQQEWGEVRPLLHPYLHFQDRATTLRGRTQVLRHLADHPTPRPPTEVEVRDGQLYRWVRLPTRRT